MGLLDRIKQKRLDAVANGQTLNDVRDSKGLQNIKPKNSKPKKKGK